MAISEGTIARNPQTNERIVYKNGQWQPVNDVNAALKQSEDAANIAAMSHPARADVFDNKSYPNMLHYDPQKGFREVTGLEKLGYGFGLGARNIAANVGEALGMVSPERVAEMRKEAAPITEQYPGNIGAFAGETAVTYPVGGVPVKAISRLSRFAGPVMRGAAEGAAQGYLTSSPEDRGAGFWSGAGVGGALPTASKMAQVLALGVPATKSARTLAAKGVTLTPGQLNPEGAWGQIEEALTGIPVIGPRIAAARGKGWQQTQNLIAQEAAPPGVKLPSRKDPEVMFNDLENAYKQAYEVGKKFRALPVIVRTQGGDIPLSAALQVPRNAVADDDSIKYANSFLKNLAGELKKKGTSLQSDDLFESRSQIRAEIRSLNKQTKAPFKAAALLEGAEQRVTDALASQLPPDVMDAVRAIDSKYGNFKVIESALYKAKDQPAGFTPSQFSMAVRESAPSQKSYAGGGGRMRNISSAAADVFQPRQPLTGRQLAALLPLAATGAVGASAAPVVTGIAAGAAALPYMQGSVGQAARNFLTGDTALQNVVRDLQRQYRRVLTPAERMAVARMLQTQGVMAAMPEQSEQ